MLGPDLNTLVNCDIIHNVNSASRSQALSQRHQGDWIRPAGAFSCTSTAATARWRGIWSSARLAQQMGFE